MKRFCVSCGKQTGQIISSLCAECYLKKNEVLPIPVEFVIDLDNRSGRIRIGRLWVENTDAAIGNMIADKIISIAKQKKLSVSGIDITLTHDKEERRIIAAVNYSAELEGIILPVQKQVTVRVRKTISDASMKIASYYHEAIIQMRFIKKPTLQQGQDKMRELMKLLLDQKKKIELSEAVDTKNVPGGFDVYVGSAKAARIVTTRIARKYNLKVIYSNKMIGMNDNGVTKYRHTYCIKFEPPAEK